MITVKISILIMNQKGIPFGHLKSSCSVFPLVQWPVGFIDLSVSHEID